MRRDVAWRRVEEKQPNEARYNYRNVFFAQNKALVST